MPDIWFTLQYRETLQDKFNVMVSDLFKKDINISTTIYISRDKERLGIIRLNFPLYWLGNYYTKKHELHIYQERMKKLIENMLRDLLYEAKIKNILGKTISMDKLDKEHKNKIYKDDKGHLDFERNPQVIAKENKIAREIILRELFKLQNKIGQPITRDALEKNCEYYYNTINNAIASLTSKNYIKYYPDHKIYGLTYPGSLYIENKLLSPYNDKIFLIAACNDDTYKLIDKVYRSAVKKNGYDLKFQEKSEPKGSIHEDIWHYINNCNVIICDFTDKRPNCFIEYGYALAKNKHIILCVEESEGKDKNGYLKVPFDTQNQKYSFWRKEWLETNNNTKLNEFRKEIQERIQMKLQIIDTEFNI